MKETFESNLSSSQKQEVASQDAFVGLKKAKEEEITAGQDSVDSKSQQLATADETLAQSKEDLDDTSASWSADKKFLMEVKVKCKMTDKEWEERQKIRQSELKAAAKAIEILSSDDARKQFSGTFNPGKFLQTRMEKELSRTQAVATLSKAASKNTHLSALVASARLDPFPKVKKAIDDMVGQILKQKDEEIKEKDFCTAELNKNEKGTAAKTHTKKKLENKIAALGQTIKDTQDSIDTLVAEMTDLAAQRKKASADRKAEQAEFLKTVADQKTTAALLSSALKVLKEVYDGKGALLQQAPPVGGAAPKDFAKYG